MTETMQLGVSKGQQVMTIFMIILIELCINIIYVISIFVGPLNEMYGWSENMIVVAYTLVMFCELPAYLIGGWLMAKFGVKKFQVCAGVLFGASILLSGLTTNVYVFIVAQGIMAGLTMMAVYLANIARINAIFPKNKGLVMGIMYGASGFGGVFCSPLLAYLIEAFNVRAVLIGEGVIFIVVLFVTTMLMPDPTKGNRELQKKIQEEADAAEAAEAIAGKEASKLPTMRWKRALRHPGIWLIFLSIIAIQMIGNVLVTDIAVLSDKIYGIDEMGSAWAVSGFSLGVGVGGILIGWISDKIGPYKTTYWMGWIFGILLVAFVIVGAKSFMIFAVVCILQGIAYGGMTTLNPIMITDSYHIDDLGIMLGVMGLSYGVVGAVGPQLGLSLPFVPMIVGCAVLCVVGGILAKMACTSLNKYYRAEGSECVVR